MKFLQTTWNNVRRSPYQALAAIFIMTMTFLVISVFTFLIVGSTKVISFFETQPQVTAFFKDDAKQENIDALKSQITKTGKVAKMKFVSKQQALALYRQQNKNDPLLLDLVTADILPSSLEISTTNISDLGAISQMLKDSPYIHEVIYQKDVISSLTAWTNALRKIGFVLTIVLALVSVFIMMIITGIKISQKREDIDIMKLIGATNWYIRWPFIFEGIFYGLVGAFIGWTISSLTLWYSTPFLASFLRGIPILPLSPIFLLELLGIEFLLAIILGAFSSFLAVLRYLK